jgi:PadR family transcriptional regulator, regulatory protein AphA
MASARTTTSYAVLGLLAVQPWTSYELAKQVKRSLRWFWPRAERRIYEEPKRLVEEGLATARRELVGRRGRTVYTITDAGRAALREWLGEPPAPPSLELEGMVKVFFADAGSLEQLLASLERIEEQATERLAALSELAGVPSRFPERRHLGALGLQLHEEQERATRRWARWARQQVLQWESTTDPGTWDADAVLAQIATTASRRA